jgi:hypothetical protein
MNMTDAVNPYQPPTTKSAAVSRDEEGVRFFNTAANLRFAESHFVLRLHPLRLIILSLALIAASAVAMIVSTFLGTMAFVMASVTSILLSALIYLSSVYRTKLQLRERWQAHGLRSGTVSSVQIDDQDLVLHSAAGIFRWPIHSLSIYRTRKGLMLSPEPRLCLFVPKRNESADNYRALQTRLMMKD